MKVSVLMLLTTCFVKEAEREAHRRVQDQFLAHLGEHNNLVEYRQFSVVSQ